MKCQILFSEKNKKNIVNLLSTELAQSVVQVKDVSLWNVTVSLDVKLSVQIRSTIITQSFGTDRLE